VIGSDIMNINWYPGHMAKTKRLIKEKNDVIDVVLELVDARMPYSSKIRGIDSSIKNKPRLMIMTKKDLCDMFETKKWIKYYEKQGYKVIDIDLEHNPNLNSIFSAIKELMVTINAKRESRGMLVRKSRVLIIGIPNVGKSTLINRLVGKKAVNVGNKPGITTSLDWIRINNEIELLDTPGILWPNLEEDDVALNLASLTAIKEEILPISRVVIYILETLSKYYPNILEERYGVKEVSDIEKTFQIIGTKRGCLIKGGVVDIEKVYTVVMNDIKNGLIKGITFDRYKDE
jgi:ribosome biogenesis GTPase A